MSTNATTRALIELKDRAEAVGWPVTVTKDGWIVTAPNGTVLTVHRTVSDSTAIKHARADFRAAGLYRAEQSHRMREEAKRKAKIKADRDANDVRTREVAGKALALGAGPYAADRIDPGDLLKPHDQMATYRVTMTPTLAAVILDRNLAMRKLREARVTFWADEIRSGRWQETHQGIALDTDGALLDGQHRLSGIVRAGAAVPVLVSVGVPRETVAVIDTGAVRSISDILAVAGVESSAPSIGAMVRLLVMFDRHETTERRRYGNDQLIAVAESVGGEELAVAYATARRMRAGANIPYAPGGVLAYLLRHRQPDQDLAESYIDGIAMGTDLPGLDPRLAVRRYFTITRKGMHRKPAEDLAVLLKGWRFHAQHRAVQMVTYKRGEIMPRLFIPGSEE